MVAKQCEEIILLIVASGAQTVSAERHLVSLFIPLYAFVIGNKQEGGFGVSPSLFSVSLH